MKDAVLTKDERVVILSQAMQLLDNSDFANGAAILERYLINSPNDVDAIHLLGTTYARGGDYERAESVFKREISLNSARPDAHFNLGLIHSHQNRMAEAIADFEATVKLDPLDTQALSDLGAIYYSQGEMEKGERYLAEALKCNPVCKDAFLNIFEILWSSKRYNQALQHAADYLQALEKSTESSEPPQVNNQMPEPPLTANQSLTFVRKAPAIIRLSESEKNDLFNEHVPQHLRPRKTGMNIAVVADFNIAGQVTQLFRLINEKTIHRARCIIIHEDYLSYDSDLILSRNNPKDMQTAMKVLESADFYHIGRFPVSIGDVDVAGYLRPDNSIVQYFGSDIRQNGWQIYNWHKSTRITGLSAWDYTMLKESPLFYHINMMFDSSRVKRAPAPEGTLKIVHPTTNRNIKKTELYLQTINSLKKDGCDIEPILIEGKTNDECLQLKCQAHMTYDQISVGIYGVSAIESMAAGHVVFGGISNFAASYHPDNPVVWVTEDDLAMKIKYYVNNRDKIVTRGQAGIEWVKQHHSPDRILRQHLYMYDFVRNGHRFLKNPDEQILEQEK